MSSYDWMDQAACAGSDSDAWFPEVGQKSDVVKEICDGCPVRAQCLALAQRLEGSVSYTYRYGVWGGLGTRERADLAAADQLELSRRAAELRAAILRQSGVDAEAVAASLGCSARTVWRARKGCQADLGEAA